MQRDLDIFCLDLLRAENAKKTGDGDHATFVTWTGQEGHILIYENDYVECCVTKVHASRHTCTRSERPREWLHFLCDFSF